MSKFMRPPGGLTVKLGCQRADQASEGPHGLCFILNPWPGGTNLLACLGEARHGLKQSGETRKAEAQRWKPSFLWTGFLRCSHCYYFDLGNLPNLLWTGLPRDALGDSGCGGQAFALGRTRDLCSPPDSSRKDGRTGAWAEGQWESPGHDLRPASPALLSRRPSLSG